jgi:TolB-like protein
VTVARAIDVSNLRVAGADAVTRAGRYSLKVPPGVYLVSVDRVGARTPPATGYARLVRVRSGRTASPPVVTRRPQGGSSGVLYQGKPAVAVTELEGSGPHAYFGRGVSNMLMTDLATSPCIVLVEWLRRAEVIAEIRRQQSAAFDPSTAVRPGRLIQPDIFVEGSVATTQSSVTVSVRLRDARTGRVIGSARASGSDGFAVEEQIASQLRDLLEGECMPPRFVGTFTGENRTAGVNRYSGSIVFVRNDTSPPEIVTYRVERVSWRHSFTAPAPCSGGGTANVAVPRPDPRLSVLVIQKQKTARGYGYAITAMFTSPKRLTMTLTCNGQPLTTPWVPGAALNTGPPGSSLAPGAGNYTDRATIKGRYESTGTASTYTWNLRAST